jgi:hypothetical protein
VTNSPLGSKFAPGGEIKNGPHAISISPDENLCGRVVEVCEREEEFALLAADGRQASTTLQVAKVDPQLERKKKHIFVCNTVGRN